MLINLWHWWRQRAEQNAFEAILFADIEAG
jgi:hypothetical protein